MRGIINLLKPPGFTSHDIVDIIRDKLKIKKVGHTGTLDPGAAGVLPVCIGKATKIADYIIDQEKEYIFELTLGVKTDTLDYEGNVEGRVSVTDSNIQQLHRIYPEFIGVIKQIPPMYSAVKKGGKKLYELAREGDKITRELREIEIFTLELKDTYEHYGVKRFLFKVGCSKGTYVRALVEDLAKASGTLGSLNFLLRTRSGPFKIEDTVLLEDFMDAVDNGMDDYILPMDKGLINFPYICLSERNSRLFKSGNFISTGVKSGFVYRIYSTDKLFLGLGRGIENGRLKPEKVLIDRQ